MNTEPVAWMVNDKAYQDIFEAEHYSKFTNKPMIPLYTHPAKELNDGGEPVKNATYWKRQYNEMSALNDRLKSSLYHANEQIKYLELHPANLTDEETAKLLQEKDLEIHGLICAVKHLQFVVDKFESEPQIKKLSDLYEQVKALQAIGGYWYDGKVRNQYIADTCFELTKIINKAILRKAQENV